MQRSEFDSLSCLNFFRFFFNSLGHSFNGESHVHFHKLYTIYNIPDLLRLAVLPCTMPYPPPPRAFVLSQFRASCMSIPLLPGIFLFFLRKAGNAYNKQKKPSTTKLCCLIYNKENWLISLLRKAVKMIKNNWRKHWLFSEIKLASTETQGLLRRGSSLRSDPSPFDRHDKSRGASVHTTQSKHWYWPYQGVGTCALVLTLCPFHIRTKEEELSDLPYENSAIELKLSDR